MSIFDDIGFISCSVFNQGTGIVKITVDGLCSGGCSILLLASWN